MEKEKAETEGSDKSKGPYTPLQTPEEVGQLSGGEYNWQHSSSKPVDETEKK